jgi:general secretion pathway protein G
VASIAVKGFTIVELLIVIVVIAILAAISVVAYNNIQDRAWESRAATLLSQARKDIELHKVQYGAEDKP